jgi:hypothetical protein
MMTLKKGIRFELEIVCENELSAEDARKWIENAMDVFCEFDSWRVKPVQTFDAIMHSENMATS